MEVKYFIFKLGNIFNDAVCRVLYMMSNVFIFFTKAFVTNILKESDIQVNGSRRSDPRVFDDRFYSLLVTYGYSGLVDAYGYGYFECNDLKELFVKIRLSKNYKWMCYHPSPLLRSFFIYHFYTEVETDVGEAYDNGPVAMNHDEDECETMSTGYWKEEISYEDSINAKHDLIARKLKLKPGMRVLDLGCGEGTLCKFISENYDVEVTGVNNTKAMIDKARRLNKGLKVNFRVMDARKITGKFDRITCIGMIEHFGPTELRKFFETVHRCLKDDGIFLLETYNFNHSYQPGSEGVLERMFGMHAYTHNYVDVVKSIEGLYVIEDCQNLRKHLALTMNYSMNKLDSSYDELVTKRGKEAFRQMKAMCAISYALFASGHKQAYHLVLSKNGLQDGYQTVT